MVVACFWDTSSNTFNFKFGEMGVTLLDLYVIAGFTTSDKPYQESDYQEVVAFEADLDRRNFYLLRLVQASPDHRFSRQPSTGNGVRCVKAFDPLDYSDCFQHLYTLDSSILDASDLIINRTYPEAPTNGFMWSSIHSLDAIQLFEQAFLHC
ncbi:hypothetical protein ACLB2K_004788 [Fragaria x ananassa]